MPLAGLKLNIAHYCDTVVWLLPHRKIFHIVAIAQERFINNIVCLSRNFHSMHLSSWRALTPTVPPFLIQMFPQGPPQIKFSSHTWDRIWQTQSTHYTLSQSGRELIKSKSILLKLQECTNICNICSQLPLRSFILVTCSYMLLNLWTLMTLLILLNDDVGCHGFVLASAVTSQHHCSPLTFMFGVCIVLPYVCGFCCGSTAFLLQLRHARLMLMPCINRQTYMFTYFISLFCH